MEVSVDKKTQLFAKLQKNLKEKSWIQTSMCETRRAMASLWKWRLQVGSLNIKGGRRRNKQVMFSELVRKKNSDVQLLQETHILGGGAWRQN